MRRIKRFLSALTGVVLVLPLMIVSSLAMELPPVRSYDQAGFTDVASDWAYGPIKTCYELGLMSGQSPGRFGPNDKVTVAEGVVVAARIHSLWRGGNGSFPFSTPWYQSAVDYAVQNNIMPGGQFSSFTTAITRAQLADLLAQVLPERDYAPINSVKVLPDVNDSTPGATSIFKLYNAGIVSGIDVYGTFAPNNSISRAQMAAIVCRLVQSESRLVFTLQPKPADLTVRTSSKALVVNGRSFYGLVDIAGEAYLPMALGEGNDAPMSDFIYYFKGDDSDWDDMAFIDVDVYHLASVLPEYCVAPPSASVIGTAQPGPTVRISSRYNNGSKVPLLTLDGQFPMAKISDLFRGCTINDRGSAVYVEIPFDSRKPLQKQEPDLVGQALSDLLRSTPKETILSIHDYLVNTLTYNPFNAISKAAYEKASEQYKLEHNRILACKYGVCQDYAELFQEMCLRAGIPCEFIGGIVEGGPHAWNRVYVDGKWLHVDCTWDDPVSSKPILQHTYYLIEPETMAKSRCWAGSDYPLPAEYDSAWEQLDPNNITSADMFRKCLVAQVMQGKTFIRLKTTQSGAYGGIFCIYAYDTGFPYLSGGYNAKTKCYEYTVVY
ncbi:MAG: hypothetical protein HFG05_13320 [Oscillibacter sp.]|nr:hypothetical protein [Oscillibacter sp.]